METVKIISSSMNEKIIIEKLENKYSELLSTINSLNKDIISLHFVQEKLNGINSNMLELSKEMMKLKSQQPKKIDYSVSCYTYYTDLLLLENVSHNTIVCVTNSKLFKRKGFYRYDMFKSKWIKC